MGSSLLRRGCRGAQLVRLCARAALFEQARFRPKALIDIANNSDNTPEVAVLTNDSAPSVTWEKEHANEILEAWCPGEEGLAGNHRRL